MIGHRPMGLGGISSRSDVGGPQLNHLVAWFDPNAVTTSGGVVTSAPNRAPRTVGAFGQTTAAWRPTWSSTGLNGTAAIHGDGTRHLDGPLSGTILGTVGSSCTCVLACLPDNSANLSGLIAETSSSTDGNNSAIVPFVGEAAPTISQQRYDSATGAEDHTTLAVTLSSASIITAIFNYIDSTHLNLTLRVNGVANGATFNPPSGGAMNAQDHIGILGQTDLQTVAFGSADWVGYLGHFMLFDTVLTAAEITFWETYIKKQTGL